VTTAYVGLGSNLEDPVRQVETALEELDRTAPVGYAEQPDFINAVARLETGLPADRLLEELQALEHRHGRTRSFRNAPRTLDLDLLLYGDLVLRTERLTVPHPRMKERAFVLEPLREIAPDLEIP
jgi:2-amino-4-hydroxy-6-hydroxymethyldihydropteridine diphosphokinase